MAKINSYKELIVWQKGMELVEAIYQLTGMFPKTEFYGLVLQMRRAAVGIPSNIAEGWARRYTREYIQFLSIANGSAAELDTQLILAERLKLGKLNRYDKAEDLLEEVQKLLATIIKKLKNINR